MATADSRSFARLLEHIERSLGFATSMYNDAYLDRRISARMRRNDVDDYRAYQRLLESDEDEQQALLDTLSVNVTSFFRNPDVWEALRPVLRDLTAEGRTKVWSAACSDGREAYSLAMLAHDDPQVREDRVSIVGTDIKREILRAATAGVYEGSETNDLETQLAPIGDYERYVTREDDSYRVAREIKRMTSFRRHDLIRESPPDRFDLVLCRNLFIYVDTDAKRAVFETLGSGLRSGGYLTIGMTETVPSDCRSWFEPVEKRLRIYRNAR
jgi:chemotaxis protein methyltransferase CheR